MTHIHPAKRIKGVYYVSGKMVNLKFYRNGKLYGLTDTEIKDFNQYIKDYKLEL